MATDAFKISMLGPSAVGKSALTLRLVQDKFVEGHDPTIEDSYQKYRSVDGKPCRLDIVDTAGQEEFKQMRFQFMRQSDGFMLVYSITDRVTFERVPDFWDDLLKTKGGKDKIIMVLCGNKADLEDARQVKREEGKAIADEYGALFLETSAKSNMNVSEAYDTLVKILREKKSSADVGPKKQRSCVIL